MAVTLNASTSSGFIQTADTSGELNLQSNGSTKLSVLSTGVSGTLVQGTAATASGSSVEFTGFPSWVKRITVTMTDVSFAAAGVARLRLGTSGSIVTTGYFGSQINISNVPAVSATALSSAPEGIAGIPTAANATTITGQFVIVNITGNTWQSNGFVMRVGDSSMANSSGFIALSGTLDRIALAATTSTFDGGTINIQYEG
jgi:hypothetical protein